MFVTILSIALVALTPSGMTPSSASAFLGGGGPDAYGYKYLDSDTTCPGAPTYNWVSIKGVGTRVTGLVDDNCVGSFPIGFEFPYYWYRVDSVVVGSNGYIAFGDKASNASDFKPVPSPQRPNNQLAALLSDLDPEDTLSPNGSVWYWSNNTDSFIVEYDSIAFWDSTGGHGNNTFQIILTKADSSVTFQYKEQSGAPFNGWGTTNNQTGIENVSGAIGVNYLSGTTPDSNAIHDSLAVRFFPPDSNLLQIHDVGVRNAMNDNSGGVFAVNGRPLSFMAVVRNYGNQSEANYQTYFKVQRSNGSVLFADSAWAGASDPGEVETLALASTWRPSTNGTYFIKVYTKLAGDMVPVNDTATVELHVLTLPGMLTYDGGVYSQMVRWSAPGGAGNRFVPPVYPCSVQTSRVFMGMYAVPSDPTIAIFDDNGPGGTPGDTLYIDTVTVTSTGDWYTVTPPSPVVIDDGAFFVGAMSDRANEPAYGYDEVLPISNQSWEENSGVWSPGRDASTRDLMANATISGTVGVFEWLQPTPAPVPARLDVNPNPFGGTTTIRLLNSIGVATTIELYDATGSIVRTLGLNRGQAVLDGRLLADGIYFARITGTEAPVAKVIVTH